MFRPAARAALAHAVKRPRLYAPSSTSIPLPDLLRDLAPSPGAYTSPAAPDLPPSAPSDAFPVAPRFSAARAREDERDRRPLFHVHFTSTRNNSIATITDRAGRPLPKGVVSGGSCGFKKSNRNSYEAGYQCAMRMIHRLEEQVELADGKIEWELVLKEYGQGRKALAAALVAVEGEKVRGMLTKVTDKTAIKVGGTRPKKRRKL